MNTENKYRESNDTRIGCGIVTGTGVITAIFFFIYGVVSFFTDLVLRFNQ